MRVLFLDHVMTRKLRPLLYVFGYLLEALMKLQFAGVSLYQQAQPTSLADIG